MAGPLERFRGEMRVLVIVAPNVEDERLAQQKRLLANFAEGMSEREMLVLLAGGDSVTVLHGTRSADGLAGLRDDLAASPDAFLVALVGKDGGVKRRWAEPVDAATIFGVVDAMPMRRREIRDRAG